MILEASEDGGTSWTRVEIPFSVLPAESGAMGILLRGPAVANLAKVNLVTLTDNRSQPRPSAGDNWWSLIHTHELQFRLTCRIEADHATRYDAVSSTTRSSLYDKTTYATTDIEETWAAPNSFFNETSSFEKIHDTGTGTTAEDADRSQSIEDLAESLRDAGNGLRLSGSFYTWQMDLSPWRIGDAVASIRGRNISLASSTGGSSGGMLHPTIVGMTVACYPTQGVTLDLDDTVVRRGA